MQIAILSVLAAIAGFVTGYALKTLRDRTALQEAGTVTKDAKQEAEKIIQDAKIQAREELIRNRDDFEQSTKERRVELQKLEERVAAKEANAERKADLVESRITELQKREEKVRGLEDDTRQQQEKLSQLILREITELERIASLDREEARRQLLQRLGEELEVERGTLIRRFQEETRQQYEREAQEIMVNAMQRYAGDCAYERTTSTVPLPNEEMKGRIIGRDGRNIRAIEAATGVTVLIDDTPEAVVVSCFDPVRRQIARVALERLVADGRIHPTRVEEMVAKVTKEIEAELTKAGRDAVEELGITGVRQNVVSLLGRLKFRYSYSQNVLKHAIEVAQFMGAIAAQLRLDEQKARRIGLFHDIGKAVDHEVEGSHAVIGSDILKRAGEDDVVVNAVGAHHEDMEGTSLFAILVGICDTLSASRPGARSETTELYLKRLEQLEHIGSDRDGVETCYAIQAGRELRVIVKPEQISEEKGSILARDIANEIEKEMRYPGQIRVTVVRETRSVEYAK